MNRLKMTRLKRLASANLQHFLMATMEGLRKAGLDIPDEPVGAD